MQLPTVLEVIQISYATKAISEHYVKSVIFMELFGKITMLTVVNIHVENAQKYQEIIRKSLCLLYGR